MGCMTPAESSCSHSCLSVLNATAACSKAAGRSTGDGSTACWWTVLVTDSFGEGWTAAMLKSDDNAGLVSSLLRACFRAATMTPAV